MRLALFLGILGAPERTDALMTRAADGVATAQVREGSRMRKRRRPRWVRKVQNAVGYAWDVVRYFVETWRRP